MRRLCRKERERSSLLSCSLAELKQSHQHFVLRYHTLKGDWDKLNEISTTLEDMVSDMIQEIDEHLQPPVSPELSPVPSIFVQAASESELSQALWDSPEAVGKGKRAEHEEEEANEEVKESPWQGEESSDGRGEEAERGWEKKEEEQVGGESPFSETSGSLGSFLQKLQIHLQREEGSHQASSLASSGTTVATSLQTRLRPRSALLRKHMLESETMKEGRKMPSAPTIAPRGLQLAPDVRDDDLLQWSRSE